MKKKLKSKKLKPIIVKDFTIGSSIWYYIGSREQIRESLGKYLEEKTKEKLDLKLNNPCVGGVTDIYVDKKGVEIIVVWIVKDTMNDGLIVHETYHAVKSIFDYIGMKICDETEELMAYLLGFYVNNLKKELSK
jgi:hypothetical protein